MTTEKHKLEITRYRTPDGIPTCAIDFKTGESCIFFRTKYFGIKELCVMDEIDRVLDRAPNDTGYLVPFDGCPVWNDER